MTNQMTRDEADDLLTTYAAALHAGDLDGVVACFTDDAVLMAPSTPTASGPELRGFYRASMDASDLDIAFTVEHLVVGGDEAAVSTTSAGTRTAADGTVTRVSSREAWVIVRSGGAWKIGRYLFNRVI